jgi:oxygen-independent coproporphyrinogen-3 oxidase
MAGIYIHIPFCKSACHYCDFHFSTSFKNKDAFLNALKTELVIQKDYLNGSEIMSIYLGGGTPSLLSGVELHEIFNVINKHYSISEKAEITLEANPDDLSRGKLKQFMDTPVNRLSIGVQSFIDEDLRYMNRTHNGEMAKTSVKLAQDTGFENISIDLIYGTPALSDDGWRSNLVEAFVLGVKHLSCYALTVEPKTALANFIQSGKSKNPDDVQMIRQFEMLLSEMRENQFVQYEISNFCKEGFHSKHNSNYWLKEHYLGVGPSAHSFNGYSRQWNVRNNNGYIRELENGKIDFEFEILNDNQKYNEYVLTSLRTQWGTDLNLIMQMGDRYYNYCVSEIQKYILTGDIIRTNSILSLTDKGKLIADKISGDLFVV